MNAVRYSRYVVHSLVVIGLLLALGWLGFPGSSQTLAQETNPMASQPVTNKELIRNGGFDYGMSAWGSAYAGSGVGNTAGQDGGPALAMAPSGGKFAQVYQELPLPTQTTDIEVSFDYRLVPTWGGAWVRLDVSFWTSTTKIAPGPSSGLVGPGTDAGWQHASVSLSPAEVDSVQDAHAAGDQVWIVFDVTVLSPGDYTAYVDNVSVKVTGSMTYPTMTGSIAYIGRNSAGRYNSVGRIEPNGSNQQKLWTSTDTITPVVYDLAWRPNAAEIAFTIDHEWGYSAFFADVFGIWPNGRQLRRITNPPSAADVAAGAYPLGTVTGKVDNDHGTVASFFLYIEGAKEPVTVLVGDNGDVTNFTVNNVADLGVGMHYVAFNWMGSAGQFCDEGGIEYANSTLDVEAGKTVDAGTLQFNGTCIKPRAQSVTWKGDGSQVGFDVTHIPRKVPAAGQVIGTSLFSGGVTPTGLAWSPTDDQILYSDAFATNKGIYKTTAGGGAGTLMVADAGLTTVAENPAWLPDGSGFVYSYGSVGGKDIYHFNLSDSTKTQLTVFYNESGIHPSPSPDGKYVVFERSTNEALPNQIRDLWIVNRTNPVEMWQLTTDGKSTNPDWSRRAVPAFYDVYVPAILRN